MELVVFTTVDGGESTEQVGQFRKTHHNVYWDHARRRFVALLALLPGERAISNEESVLVEG
eukprot:6091823-Pleurochrysis_carterae.AAC.1